MKQRYRNILRIIFIAAKLFLAGAPMVAMLMFLLRTYDIDELLGDEIAYWVTTSFLLAIGGVLYDLDVIRLKRKNNNKTTVRVLYRVLSFFSGISFLSFGVFFIYQVVLGKITQNTPEIMTTAFILLFIALVIFVDLYLIVNYIKAKQIPKVEDEIRKIGRS